MNKTIILRIILIYLLNNRERLETRLDLSIDCLFN